MLHAEGCYPSRNAATEAIHETPAGGTLHASAEPPPLLRPEESPGPHPEEYERERALEDAEASTEDSTVDLFSDADLAETDASEDRPESGLSPAPIVQAEYNPVHTETDAP
jgi:hypothetical protein